MTSSRAAAAIAALLLAASPLAAGAQAVATPAATPAKATLTRFERAELAQLSPSLRKKVLAEMGPENTVRGILDTMLLNNISALIASNRLVAVDFEKGIAVVETKAGKVEAVPFDIATLVVKKK